MGGNKNSLSCLVFSIFIPCHKGDKNIITKLKILMLKIKNKWKKKGKPNQMKTKKGNQSKSERGITLIALIIMIVIIVILGAVTIRGLVRKP